MGEELIEELLSDPQAFAASGRAYALLQAYFKGLPVETLRPLLRSGNASVERAAAFVASELGRQAQPVLDDVIPLLSSKDRHIQYYAMDVLVVCAMGEQVDRFWHLAKMLDSEDAVLRGQAMHLISRADASQIAAASTAFDRVDTQDARHTVGLDTLAAGDRVASETVEALIASEIPLLRRYGAIAALRAKHKSPDVIAAVAASADPDLRKFLKDARPGHGQ